MSRDHYEVLGVAPTASDAEIKRAYRRMAMRWHPDRHPGQNTEAIFKDINAAYQCLKNPLGRAAYDRARARAQRDPRPDPPRSNAAGPSQPQGGPRPPPPPPPRKKPPSSSRPPSVLCAVALVALFGWNWVAARGEMEASAPREAERPTVKAERTEPPPAVVPQEERSREPPPTEVPPPRVETPPAMPPTVEAPPEASSPPAHTAETPAISATERPRPREQTADAAQSVPLPRARRPQTDPLRTERMARWNSLLDKLFGMPLAGGSPCRTPLLRGSECADIRTDSPHALSFTVGAQAGESLRASFDVKLTLNELSLHYHPVPCARNAHDNDLDRRTRDASRRLLARFGFTAAMIDLCRQEGSGAFTSAALVYRCTYQVAANPEFSRILFSVALRDAGACRTHPLCPSGDKDRVRTSRQGAGSASKVSGRR
jgi:DnaJ domain